MDSQGTQRRRRSLITSSATRSNQMPEGRRAEEKKEESMTVTRPLYPIAAQGPSQKKLRKVCRLNLDGSNRLESSRSLPTGSDGAE
jgi:hypothetical protein